VKFSDEKFKRMTKWTSYLVNNEQRVHDGKLKGGTHIVSHGFRYAYGEIRR